MEFEHKGRKFKLRDKFYVRDLKITNRLDKLFIKIAYDKDKNEITSKQITKEEMTQFLHDVLIPLDGEKIPFDFFDDLEQTKAMEIFTSFFLLYLRLSMDMQNILTKFATGLEALQN